MVCVTSVNIREPDVALPLAEGYTFPDLVKIRLLLIPCCQYSTNSCYAERVCLAFN